LQFSTEKESTTMRTTAIPVFLTASAVYPQNAMSTAELEGEAVRRQMERVLESPGFVRNERLSRFLRFVVDRHLEGRGLELKESVIGVEVFSRSPGYNPQHDPIVRTEARRLRTRLSEYYQSPGAETAVVIELPKGGYLPVVRFAPAQSPISAATAGSWLKELPVVILACLVIASAVIYSEGQISCRATGSGLRTEYPGGDSGTCGVWSGRLCNAAMAFGVSAERP